MKSRYYQHHQTFQYHGCLISISFQYWADICFCDTNGCNKDCMCGGAAGISAFAALTFLAVLATKIFD
jgi:hypothetical protein